MKKSNAKPTLKVGIAGYGVVGKRRHHFIDKHPRLEVVAVCDQNYKESGVLDNGIRYYPEYKALLKEKLDILFVCVPNYLAAEVTIAGLEHGLHVFCEKPPGRDLDDIARVIEAEKKRTGQKLMYGFNHRYHDSVQDALRIIQSRELGELINLRGVYGKSKIISFESDWRTQRKLAGGGILLDQGIHMVDMMRLFVKDSGDDFEQVHSFISNRHWNHDVEDNAYALMRTRDGVVAMLHSSATQWRHRFRLEITLSKGALILSGILSGSKSYGAEQITVVYASEHDGGDPKEVTTRYNKDHSWADEVNEFAAAILDNRPIHWGSSADAYETMELVYRIYCADQDWKETYGLSASASSPLPATTGARHEQSPRTL